MKLYSENKNYKLYQGNMLDMLEVIEKESIDSIVTDPPYGLTSITKRFGKEGSAPASTKNNDGSFARLSKGFMGKEWDGSGIEYNIDTWQKCFEVLKPGGYLLAFGGSRTFHRIAVAIEDAGFEIRDTIMWLYGSGFPKSMDISKQIDKRNGRNYNDDFKTYINNKRLEKNISFKTINEKLGTSTNGGGMASNIFGNKLEKNNVLPTKEQYEIIKELLELDNRYDDLINTSEAEREVIGKGKAGLTKGTIANFAGTTDFDITAPATDLAKQWQGWGTALKPSFEPIIVARKPFKGSLVDNVIEHGVGGINIDECRVEYEKTTNPATNPLYRQQNADKYKQVQGGELSNGAVSWTSGKNGVSEGGRFPANTILTYDETDFDEVCGGFPDTKSNKFSGKLHDIRKGSLIGSSKTLDINYEGGYTDSGSASRYFYCAKASKKDRDEGCQDLEDTVNACSNQAIAELKRGNDTFSDETNSTFNKVYKGKNTHPTVKPTELMQYLVRLVTPNNGIVLDPFNGSGSTGKAVMYENKERNKNYKYIGIELTEEYLPIAKARIEYVCNLPKNDNQTSIFDFIDE